MNSFTPPKKTHPCAVPGCGTEVSRHRLMCGPHWEIVPSSLQWQVDSAYRRHLLGKISIDQLRAVQQSATAAVVAVMGGVE